MKFNNILKIPGGESIADHIYSFVPEAPSLSIGKPSEGHVSNYYLGTTITDEEVTAIHRQAELEGINIINTRYTPKDNFLCESY